MFRNRECIYWEDPEFVEDVELFCIACQLNELNVNFEFLIKGVTK